MEILFHFENIDPFKVNKALISAWVESVIGDKGRECGNINYIFCDDEFMLNINREYLNHNYYTDVIAFDYSENRDVSGDIYISIDRVKDNGLSYRDGFEKELLRVIIHGILHFLGYSDTTPSEKKKMRKIEDVALKSYFDML